MQKNIVLIGMPGAGKSTVGVLLAKALGMNFLDTDILIQNSEKRMLQEIIDSDGVEKFIQIENKVLSLTKEENTVIATGGSAVYGIEAMQNFASNGIVVYLKMSPALLIPRLSNIKTRGIAIKPGQSIDSLYNERDPLYKKYADFIIDTDAFSTEDSVAAIISKCSGLR